MVIGRIATDPQFARLAQGLAPPGRVVSVSGLWGSAAPLVAAEIARRTGRTILFVTAHLQQADEARDDLELFAEQPCELLSAWETLPGEGPAAGEIAAERHRLCAALAWDPAGPGCRLIVAPVQALMQPAASRETLRSHTLHLTTGQRAAPDELAGWLSDHGFVRLERIESPGDFARRGDILDFFAPGDSQPLRVEFNDAHVESLRTFDVGTHRSTGRLPAASVCVVPQSGPAADAAPCLFFDFLPADAIVAFDEAGEIQETAQVLLERLGRPPSMYEAGAVIEGAGRFTQLHMSRFGGAATAPADSIHFNVRSLLRFEGKASSSVEELLELAAGRQVHVVCENEGEAGRLRELIVEAAGALPDSITFDTGYLHRGFEWFDARTVIVGHHELFNRTRPRRRIRRAEAVRPIESWLELEPGDVVVHATHGIARFRAMKTMRKSGTCKTEEFLTLEFADRAVLHVPVSQIDLVQKYVGAGAGRPQLSKLGGTRWNRTKAKVGEAVAEMAESLLGIQAARQMNEGIAYPADTQWQREYEEAFPYEETEDQLIVAEDIKEDLRRSRPMDRLLCGDVGYGKTELAMRAAFKVVEYGKQVAVLVPTTVLAEQHSATFTARLADYPFIVGCLSRFRTPREQKRLLDDVTRGKVDVIIGTHRLLSKDVSFADLGLVVIDEEQRFGVEHKERLKRLRETVDVLTMTATPIPRTLHMALLGIRDISSLATPPVDRRAIATQVVRFDAKLVRDAIIRELNRDGQVYFVHNLVRSIESVAAKVRSIVPECRVLVGHGQMKDRQLEGVMERFVNREADVLVATTIIESGIDIPSVNTIFINLADRYGLSDLHQLRGRVGRGKHRAYCYLLLPESRTITPKAARRLKSIEEFSELGAGFRIAMRDLEIRGAGNILGREQSGHIAAVGYEMYCRLLEEAVARVRNEPQAAAPSVHLELGTSAYVPRSYVTSERSRIEIYRRTVACRVPLDLQQLEADIADAFGPIPKPVSRLLELAELRVLAGRRKIISIIAEPPDIVFSVADLSWIQPLFEKAPGSVRMPDPRTIYLRPGANYFEPPTLLAFLRRLLSKQPAAQETVA